MTGNFAIRSIMFHSRRIYSKVPHGNSHVIRRPSYGHQHSRRAFPNFAVLAIYRDAQRVIMRRRRHFFTGNVHSQAYRSKGMSFHNITRYIGSTDSNRFYKRYRRRVHIRRNVFTSYQVNGRHRFAANKSFNSRRHIKRFTTNTNNNQGYSRAIT